MSVAIDTFFHSYGGLAIFLGAGLEGEAAVTTGGFLAHKGYVHPAIAAACAFGGSFVTDQAIFLLARYHRESRLLSRVRTTAAFARAINWIEAYPRLFCVVFRFIYGLRIAGPIAIGMSRIPVRRFVALNAVSAAIWASVFTFIGYRFGHAFEDMISRILSSRGLATAVFITGVAAAIIWWRTSD